MFSDGWRPSLDYEGPRWVVAFSGELASPDPDVWLAIAAGRPVILPDAGQLVQFTHAQALAEIFAGA